MRSGIIALALVMVGCGAEDEFAEAKEIAARDLRDPESARFRNMSKCFGNPAVVEGERNGKNAYGAYAGYQRFWVMDRQVYTSEDSSTEDFTKVMAACSGMTTEEFQKEMSKPST